LFNFLSSRWQPALIRRGHTGCLGMRVLWEIKGQHEWLTARIGDFDATACKCGLSDETDFRVDFTKLHVLVIAHFEFSNPAAASIGMEERRTLRTELGLGAGR